MYNTMQIFTSESKTPGFQESPKKHKPAGDFIEQSFWQKEQHDKS